MASEDEISSRLEQLETRMGHFESRLETVETNAAWLKQRSRWAVAAFFVLELALAAYQQQMMPAQQPAQSLTVQP